MKCESDYMPAQEQTQTVGREEVGVGSEGRSDGTIVLVLAFIAMS